MISILLVTVFLLHGSWVAKTHTETRKLQHVDWSALGGWLGENTEIFKGNLFCILFHLYSLELPASSLGH